MTNAVAMTEVLPMDEPTRSTGTVLTPMTMLDRAVAGGASIEVMTQLMALQERYEKNQARKEFDAAMAAVRAELPNIGKNREVDFTSAKGRTNYRHEDLGEVTRVAGPILARHGLSFRWRTETPAGGPIIVTCIVSHRDGHFEENTLSAGRDDSGNKNSIQQIGSTITYLQRYTLKAAIGVAATNDDDGKAVDTELEAKVSEEQIGEIRQHLEAAGRDVRRFCTRFKIDSIADLPAREFARAVQAIQTAPRVTP